MKHFKPISPDPVLKKHKGDGALARFGHLNVIVDKFNEFDNKLISAAGLVGSPTPLIVGFNLITPVGLASFAVLPCLSDICACTGGCGPVAPVVIKNNGLIALTITACGTETINGGASFSLGAGLSISVTDTSCTSWETF